MHRNKLGLIAASVCLLFSLACGHKQDEGGTADTSTAAGTDQSASTVAPFVRTTLQLPWRRPAAVFSALKPNVTPEAS